MFGDLERWITPDELTEFDIVTYGFGDQHRVCKFMLCFVVSCRAVLCHVVSCRVVSYSIVKLTKQDYLFLIPDLRGQFTIHRNDPEKINQLWRPCDYLSHMDTRFEQVLSKEETLHFESAEGCYSAAVLERDDIKIKYAVKAFTDAEQEKKKKEDKDTAYTHGVYVGTGKKKDRTIIYKAGMDNRRGLSTIPSDWFERKGSIYNNPNTLLYKSVGKREMLPMIEKESVKCMYWAQKKYQSRLCIDGVDSTDTIYWIHGQLYKEKYELVKLPGDIVTAPFFHFQEWKRYYRRAQLGGFQRNGPFAGFVLSKEGILPFYSTSADKRRTSGGKSRDNNSEKVVVPSPLGHTLFQWHGIESNDREQLPHRFYCLQSAMKESPPTTKCKFVTSWRDSLNVEILSGAPAWSKVDIDLEVTMAITLQLHADQLSDSEAIQGFFKILALYLNRWQGQPVVIVVHVAGATPEFITTMRSKLGPESNLSNFGMDTVLVAAIFSEKPDTVSRKALMNMAIDASPTRFVIAGYELERGIIPSQDTSYLAHRTAQIHEDSPGAVYIIPQFGLVDGDHDFTMDALNQAHLDGRLKPVSKVEEGECEGDNASLENEENSSFGMIEIEKLWWEFSQRLPNQKAVPMYEMTVEKQASALDNIQSKLTSLLTEKYQYNLYATDTSPILLFDNLGPNTGMISSDMVREIDEFGGKLCYNSIRLAQMATLGYHINILSGVYAISTPVLRKAIGDPSRGPLGVSRCDGCFFFTKERAHEDILENISLEERQRPAKIAILWEHSIE